MLACFCFASFESLSTFNIFLKHDYIKNWWEIFYLKKRYTSPMNDDEFMPTESMFI